jgi:hypothetical protein
MFFRLSRMQVRSTNAVQIELNQAIFRSPPGLPQWFTGFCTTHLAPEIGIEVVQMPVSTEINPAASLV